MLKQYDTNEDIIEFFDENGIVGKTISDIFFSDDEPNLDKNSMKTLFVNYVSSHHTPLSIRESDIPDDLLVTRGRAVYGCNVSLIFNDMSAITIDIDADIDSSITRLSNEGESDRELQKSHNIDERLLFEPIFDTKILSYSIKNNKENSKKGIHNITFVLDNGKSLYISGVGVYIFEKDDEPMQISMGEKKRMIKDYSSLFDNEFVWR